MSDYSIVTGNMIPSSYVHVVSTQGYDGNPLVKCQCKVYQMLQNTALLQLNLTMGDRQGAVLDGTTTCMHCRFFLQYLAGIHIKIWPDGRVNKLEQRIMQALDSLNKVVVLLGEVVLHGPTKFLVQGKEEGDFSIVSVTFRQEQCFGRCLKGLCSASLGNKKKMPKVTSIQNHQNLCPHMGTWFKNIKEVRMFFPEHFKEEEHQLEGDIDDEEKTRPVARRPDFHSE